jgi:beta-xylosidase
MRRFGPPVSDAYVADPFVLRVPGGFVAYGTDPTADAPDAFPTLSSPDLRRWQPSGFVLARDERIGTDYWAPEVVHADGAYWMYYSAGRGIGGHHLRVARSADPLGPFEDLGLNLTPDEPFAIDAHPFRDRDGRWYLYFARDVLDSPRPGTHLAVAPMLSMTSLGDAREALAPNAQWQVYEHDRAMYGRRFDWHTLEGPTVLWHGGRYHLLFSGGSWEGPSYGVGAAVAAHPLGPWRHVARRPVVMSRATTGLIGPGHNSVLTDPVRGPIVPFHAWDAERTRRQLHLGVLRWRRGLPVVAPLPAGRTPSRPG